MLNRFEAFVAGISACCKSVQRIKTMEMTEFGLRGTTVMCIFHLHRHPEGLTGAQLCQLCGEDKAAISRTLAELQEKGYAAAQEGAKKYRLPIHLTPAGEQVAQAVDVIIADWVQAAGSELTDEQRETFYFCLESIARRLQEIPIPSKKAKRPELSRE